MGLALGSSLHSDTQRESRELGLPETSRELPSRESSSLWGPSPARAAAVGPQPGLLPPSITPGASYGP